MRREMIEKYKKIQNIAKQDIDFLSTVIKAGITEKEIADASNSFMIKMGITSFWYHGVGSFVLVGKRTTLSISGNNYSPSKEKVGENDIVTVDLSPQSKRYWGDFARTFLIEGGRVVRHREDHVDGSNEFYQGINTEKWLHIILQRIADPFMTFGHLYSVMNAFILEMGYENIDFRGNLGHSIEKTLKDRRFIEKGSLVKLKDKLFTFEPHIKRANSKYGYKMEDIYYFEKDRLCIL